MTRTTRRPVTRREIFGLGAAGRAFVGKGYDRPVSKSMVWVPEGWPERTSAVTLTDAEVERSRESLDLEPASVADIGMEWFRERMDGLTGRAPQSGTYLVGKKDDDGADAS